MFRKKFTRDTLKFPQKDFDMIKEGVISLAITGILIVAVAVFLGAPYRPAITNQQIANQEPIVVEKTALGDLDGTGEMAQYGPPYNHGFHGEAPQSVQSLGGFSPQTWWGTPYPLNTATDDVLQPLKMLATASDNQNLLRALRQYETAPYIQQQQWANHYAKALQDAKVIQGQVVVPPGSYGPVQTLMNSELSLAKSGLLSGALDRISNPGTIYRYNIQDDLLFLQGHALHQIAGKLDMKGEQWGINHDEAAVPGPWWLTPYTFLYQIPPWSTSASGDEMAAYTIAILFLMLVFLPWIPGLNQLNRVIPVHRWIWRDWYKRLEKSKTCSSCPLRTSCHQEFKGKYAFVPGESKPACYEPTSTNFKEYGVSRGIDQTIHH
ncbi:cytochrome B6 [Alicyclobacillus sp. TC]|uniref:Cytochrome B6 n=1 Tax=Alicyclobacillus tolerans TaxID=90970 RepID=A0ABT9M023_9BACL|nr:MULTISPECIES: hypothetical protein [Alicyclobacillus]MDP9729859.1 hypothetical protein [Alicyclobacillus tengchongensis]QRF23579.1 cytochrome B6 [Alicyclobacillus sp. TC]